MKIAVIGSRNIEEADIGWYISEGDEIVSGGATGVDTCAADYASKNGIRLTVFFTRISTLRSGGADSQKQTNSRSCRQGYCFLGRKLKRNPFGNKIR